MHDFTPIPALVGGVLIGLSASLVLLTHGKIAGISGLYAGVLGRSSEGGRGFPSSFIGGLVAGGVLLRIIAPSVFATTWNASLPMALLAGVVVGIGTQLGNGCTSGHGVCGISRLSMRSIIATITFIFTGVATVFVVRHVLGGAP